MLLIGSNLDASAEQPKLVPLIKAIQESPDKSYAFIRCAALRYSHIKWSGEDRFTPQALDEAKIAFAQFMQVADSIRHGRNDPRAIDISDDIYLDMRDIGDLYLQRFRESYAATGVAFDDLWLSDLQTCKQIVGKP